MINRIIKKFNLSRSSCKYYFVRYFINFSELFGLFQGKKDKDTLSYVLLLLLANIS
jgi:hypothetical protein